MALSNESVKSVERKNTEVFNANEQPKNKKKGMNKKADLIFYICMIAYPVIQFCIFYVGVNFNSIILTFQKFDPKSGELVGWTLWDNLGGALRKMSGEKDLFPLLMNSLKVYGLSFIISVPLGLFFSFGIYKKIPLGNFFRVMLFMPSIISGVIMVTIYMIFCDEGYPEIAKSLFGATGRVKGLLENKGVSDFGAIFFYNTWFGFGGGVLMYSNAMSGNISPEMVEAAELEGCSGIKEFLYITFPLIFPTFSTFTITGVAGIFTNQFGLYTFFGAGAGKYIQTYGYYLYIETLEATQTTYPMLASMGVWLTLVAAPITFIVKWFMEKIDPTAD